MRIKAQRIQEQIDFAAADTICFFAPYPAELTALQRQKWLPLIDRINAGGAEFTTTEGLNVPDLSDKTKAFLKKRLEALNEDDFNAFCAVSGGCRSVILAFHVLDGFLSAEDAFELAVLEETYQNQFWKTDEDAVVARENRKRDVISAAEKMKGISNG